MVGQCRYLHRFSRSHIINTSTVEMTYNMTNCVIMPSVTEFGFAYLVLQGFTHLAVHVVPSESVCWLIFTLLILVTR